MCVGSYVCRLVCVCRHSLDGAPAASEHILRPRMRLGLKASYVCRHTSSAAGTLHGAPAAARKASYVQQLLRPRMCV
jgi:hypothetical protein